MIPVRVHRSRISKDINTLEPIVHVYLMGYQGLKVDRFFSSIGLINQSIRKAGIWQMKHCYFEWKIVVLDHYKERPEITPWLFEFNGKTRELLPAWMVQRGEDISALLMFHPEILDGKYFD